MGFHIKTKNKKGDCSGRATIREKGFQCIVSIDEAPQITPNAHHSYFRKRSRHKKLWARHERVRLSHAPQMTGTTEIILSPVNPKVPVPLTVVAIDIALFNSEVSLCNSSGWSCNLLTVMNIETKSCHRVLQLYDLPERNFPVKSTSNCKKQHYCRVPQPNAIKARNPPYYSHFHYSRDSQN